MALRKSPRTTALVTRSSLAQPRMPPIRPKRTTNVPKTTMRLTTRASSQAFDLGGDALGRVRFGLAAGGSRHRRQAFRIFEQGAHRRNEVDAQTGIVHRYGGPPLHEVVSIDSLVAPRVGVGHQDGGQPEQRQLTQGGSSGPGDGKGGRRKGPDP